ncbi:scavenger receptor cysteine-rich domain superfamily protein-like [Diadema antillarum]|uniref:scavenger receptor cysteine-rich domain superfamily protein-like n=1 Tax=Diadema antillarum TaxID=105358 RepID=UPI003A8C28FC
MPVKFQIVVNFDKVKVQSVVPGSVRLVDGSVDSEGRVEVFLDDTWGAICDNLWGPEDAEVVCKQLGYVGADLALVASPFQRGNSPVLLDKVQCNGLESNISTCQHAGIGVKSCHESQTAGVTCTTVGSLRLVNGSTSAEGRVEVLTESGEWGTVCDDNWDIADARVVCRELGYPDALEAVVNSASSPGEPRFGRGSGPIVLDGVYCSAEKTLLRHCSVTKDWGVHDCSHAEDAGVICETKTVRIVDGEYPDEGRVEVFYGGTWGTICTHEWSIEDAHVVCKQLGHPVGARSIKVVPSVGRTAVLLDGLLCNGSEASLSDCLSSGWANNENCDSESAQMAGVVCNVPSVVVELLSGSSSRDGIVRYREDTISGLICDQDWGEKEAAVICRQLGYVHGNSTKLVPLGTLLGRIFFRDYQCDGTETQLSDCPFTTRSITQCNSNQIAQVTCGPPNDYDIRFAGSKYSEQGRVEVFLDGRWGVITDGYVTYNTRSVICRHMGYAGFNSDYTFDEESFPRGTLPILIENLGCSGDELRIDDCYNVDVVDGQTRRTREDEVSVICFPYESVANHPVRLLTETGRVNTRYGIVQIYHDGMWGAVCDTYFSSTELLCKELGHSRAGRGRILYSYETEGVTWPSPHVWFDMSYCSSYSQDNIDKVFECGHGAWKRAPYCSNEELAIVTCVGELPHLHSGSDSYPDYEYEYGSGLATWEVVLISMAVVIPLGLIVCCCWRSHRSTDSATTASATYVQSTHSTRVEVASGDASSPPPAYAPPSPKPEEAPPTYESVSPDSAAGKSAAEPVDV